MVTRDLRDGSGNEPTAHRAPQPGDLFDGRYQIQTLLGEGGFGSVFGAHDTSLGRAVAIKVLGKAANDATVLARFLQEARAAASLESEHVARVYEVGVSHGVPYLVMERLRGRDLHDERGARLRIPQAEAVELVLQAALGVAHAHAQGIVHRDLKPRNLFLAQRADGTQAVKVLDFGIAKFATVELTETGATLGTTRYMAPEQLKSSRTVDARADIWALGVVLYELTTGDAIFDATNSAEFGVMILTDRHVPLRTRVPELSVELEAVIDRCLAKDPADRYTDLGAFARALVGLGGSAAFVPRIETALGAKPVHNAGQVTTAAPGSTAARGEVAAPSRDRRATGLMIGSLVAGAAGIAFGTAMWMRSPDQAAAPDPGPAELASAAVPIAPAPDAVTPPDAAVIVAADAPAVSAVPADAAGVARDAAHAVSRPESRTPSKAQIEAMYQACDIRVSQSQIPVFLLAPGTSATAKQYACKQLALLGCTVIKSRCASDAISDTEKTQCRNYQASLRAGKACP